MTLKTWMRGGSIPELNGRQSLRIACESKFLCSEQVVGYAGLARTAYRDARRSGPQRSGNWPVLVRGHVA